MLSWNDCTHRNPSALFLLVSVSSKVAETWHSHHPSPALDGATGHEHHGTGSIQHTALSFPVAPAQLCVRDGPRISRCEKLETLAVGHWADR